MNSLQSAGIVMTLLHAFLPLHLQKRFRNFEFIFYEQKNFFLIFQRTNNISVSLAICLYYTKEQF